MKKQLVIIGIFTLLFCVGLSGCELKEKETYVIINNMEGDAWVEIYVENEYLTKVTVNSNETKSITLGGTEYRHVKMLLYLAPYELLSGTYNSTGEGLCVATINREGEMTFYWRIMW